MPGAHRFVISNGFKLQSPNTICNTLAQFTTLFSHLSHQQIWKIQLLMHRPEGLQGCWKSWNFQSEDLCFFPFNTDTLCFSTVQCVTCLGMDMAPEPSLWGEGNASGHLFWTGKNLAGKLHQPRKNYGGFVKHQVKKVSSWYNSSSRTVGRSHPWMIPVFTHASLKTFFVLEVLNNFMWALHQCPSAAVTPTVTLTGRAGRLCIPSTAGKGLSAPRGAPPTPGNSQEFLGTLLKHWSGHTAVENVFRKGQVSWENMKPWPWPSVLFLQSPHPPSSALKTHHFLCWAGSDQRAFELWWICATTISKINLSVSIYFIRATLSRSPPDLYLKRGTDITAFLHSFCSGPIWESKITLVLDWLKHIIDNGNIWC